MIDLHTHSTESDGTLTPEELMALAKESGLSAIALTDHDTVGGLPKARAAAKKLHLEFVPGIEFSTGHLGREIHILGYYIQESDPAFLTQLNVFIRRRDARNEKMAALLQKEGFGISMEALSKEYPGSVITRAHFARYLVEHGFVKDRETVFREYLGEGCRCYVPREKITPFDAIRLIHLAGGLAFFAHPVLCRMEPEALRRFARELAEAGLDGLEAIYPLNTPKDAAFLKDLAGELGLLVSGGSDFHGANKPDIRLGTGRGNLAVPDAVLAGLKARLQVF